MIDLAFLLALGLLALALGVLQLVALLAVADYLTERVTGEALLDDPARDTLAASTATEYAGLHVVRLPHDEIAERRARRLDRIDGAA